MTARQLAMNEPWLEDGLLLLAIAGSVLELALGVVLVWVLLAGG